VGRFIDVLEISALMARGNFTLEKNPARGTLIEALELLRGYLKDQGFPLPKIHPTQTYQRILDGIRGPRGSLRETRAQIRRV